MGILLRYCIGSDSDETSFARGIVLCVVLTVPVTVSIGPSVVESVAVTVVAAHLPAFSSIIEVESKKYRVVIS